MTNTDQPYLLLRDMEKFDAFKKDLMKRYNSQDFTWTSHAPNIASSTFCSVITKRDGTPCEERPSQMAERFETYDQVIKFLYEREQSRWCGNDADKYTVFRKTSSSEPNLEETLNGEPVIILEEKGAAYVYGPSPDRFHPFGNQICSHGNWDIAFVYRSAKRELEETVERVVHSVGAHALKWNPEDNRIYVAVEVNPKQLMQSRKEYAANVLKEEVRKIKEDARSILQNKVRQILGGKG